MPKQKHSPSPWDFERAYTVTGSAAKPGPNFAVVNANGYTVATAWGHSLSGDETKANARLMIAAPDLLGVCVKMVEFCDTDKFDDADEAKFEVALVKLIDAVRAAIAKAVT